MGGRIIADRYSLDAEVGRGGMGAVWRGTDTVLGRTVALKRVGIAPGGATPDIVRAEREARLAAQLNDPHVVAVFDLVEDGAEQWLVMEYVDGTDLADLIRRHGALEPDRVAPILAQTAGALAAAHASGIVHRDVKPANILVTADGQVKLSDFGIARTEADAALTQTGLVTGSPAYLSPEVASGRQATPASDVWSLGATLYHALEGHAPYDLGDNLLGGLYRIVHEDPPRPSRPGWLAPLPAGTMTRDPAARWTADQVQAFLEAGPAFAPATQTQELAPAGRTRPTRLLLVVAAALVLALTAAAFAIGRDRGGSDGDRAGGGTASRASTGSSAPAAGHPTADGMRTFLQRYLATVVTDDRAAFAMLTPAYQQQSGGLPGYRRFWGAVTATDLISVQPDPATLVVDYTYRYDRTSGRPQTERHQMQLAYVDGHYLIAGQA